MSTGEPMDWTLDSILTITVACPIVALLIVGGTFTGRHGDWTVAPIGWIAAGVGLLCVPLIWVGMYPWKAEYHSYRPVAGVVETIDSRLLGNGEGGSAEKFVVRFVGDPMLYGVTDTRAASVRPGDRLSIRCVRQYQWTGTHGYNCSFDTVTPAGDR